MYKYALNFKTGVLLNYDYNIIKLHFRLGFKTRLTSLDIYVNRCMNIKIQYFHKQNFYYRYPSVLYSLTNHMHNT